MIKAGIIGATGYAGEELCRILLGHPQAELAAVSSVSFAGKAISEVYPSLRGIFDGVLTGEEEVIARSDVIFASLPHGLSEPLAEKALAAGKKFIDLGADFRLDDPADYTQWYGLEYKNPGLHAGQVYGLPELYREKIAKASLVGNPGCYPTSIALGMAPAMKAGILDAGSIIIDSKSGVTGAGRGLSQTTHYPDCNEAFSPYKVAAHRHTPEIEQTLSDLGGEKVTVTFVPHLLPVNRGIVSTIYASLKKELAVEEIHALYKAAWGGEKFVRVLDLGQTANLKNVKYSNYCDISIHVDGRTGRLIVVSVIDNMVKGAAGQAVQNMNLLFGLPEAAGLEMVPPAF
ncbi:MAG: N-acetyl-gamma-glutamyl-phosphate reductase [Oscillospiraceae bacterium]|nr:N-acetyl-gamma-glutamyl-phosphate reductase [Oscillospiraceae bacterium]